MLRDTSSEVSILSQGPYLVASVHTALDDTQMVRFRHDLIDAVARRGARGVIIDVAALDVLDSLGSRTVHDIVEMARLHGARTVVVGIRPDVAFAMVRLGTGVGTIHAAQDLDEALDLLGGSTQLSRPDARPAMKTQDD
jgi:rsbT antagonist protein RsbS